MPRRWLSVRTQKEGDRSTQSVTEGFDFAFGIKSGSPLSSPTSSDSNGPYVFNEQAHYTRRKPDLTLLIERPQSSRRSSRFSGSLSGPRSGNSCIGVAFGSPHHPPQDFGVSQSDMNSSRHRFVDSPSPVRTPSVNKWKKIGGLFRPRANSDKGSPLQYQQHVDTTSQHKLGLPIHRPRWRNPKSPPVTQDDFDTYRVPVRSESMNRRPRTSHGYKSRTSQDGIDVLPVPSLQVKIPGSPFERYSVMFKNLNATPQLSIGRRRSYVKEMKQDTVLDPSPIQQDAPVSGPGLKRRVTSPTVSKSIDNPAPDRPPSSLRPTNSSRYSLFPATPTTSRPQSQHRASNQILTRPSTAPGQRPPSQYDGSPPKKQRREISISNHPEPTVDLQKELPCPGSQATAESRRPSSHSRRSSSGEIFFDVKSLRDSEGTNPTQYVIARPASTDVQLARSMSNARKKSQRPSRPSPKSEAHKHRPSKSTDSQIDDTIALVESFTSATSATAITATQESNSITPKKVTSQHQQLQSLPPKDTAGPAGDNKRMRSPKSRSELNIAVPSPVLESIEEASPRTIHSRHSIALMTEGPGLAGLNLVTARTRANSNDTQTLKPQLRKELPLPPPPPPQVPPKDSKFIPLSKYAPRHTTEELARHTGFRHVRPQRSNTDDSASYNGGVPVFRRQFPPGRSCTMPSLYGSAAPEEAKSQPMLTNRRFVPRPDQEVPMVVTYVQPSAEVSVARTISLSRKSSAKITVSRQPSRNAMKVNHRSEEELTEKEVPQRMPTLLEVNTKHKPGISQNAVVEVETTIPSSPTIAPSGCDFAKTLDVFPTPPMLSV